MRNKFLCVHAHFSRLPPENPWLGEVEPEEKVDERCALHAASPLRSPQGALRDVVNNYASMSFDFAPPLISWISEKRPSLYASILEAGRGNALAAPYVPAILPLAAPRDKKTLIRWGLADFRFRYGRPAEGFWLPETAVDEETLELLIGEGLRFTVLAPSQALTPEKLSIGQPYRWTSRLDPAKRLAVFFYHQALSCAAASGEPAQDGRALARRILGYFRPDGSTELVSVALDAGGAEAVSLAVRSLEDDGVVVANYARFLELYPPPQEIEIQPRSSSTCPHGVARWAEDCLCRPQDARAGIKWRAPLRRAVDWLSESLDQSFSDAGKKFFQDPWLAREDYIQLVLDSSPQGLERFLARAPSRRLSPLEIPRALSLLESQRQRLLMQDAAAWEEEGPAGPGAVQALRRAACAMDLTQGFGPDFSKPFKERLSSAASAQAPRMSGSKIYAQEAESARIDIQRAAACSALMGFWEEQDPAGCAHGFMVETMESLRREKVLARGFYAARLELKRRATQESLRAVAVVHQRDRLDMACWIKPDLEGGEPSLAALAGMFDELEDDAFRRELSRILGRDPWGIEALFGGERRAVIRAVMTTAPASPQRKFLKAFGRAARRLGFIGDNLDEVLEMIPQAGTHGIPGEDLPYLEAVKDRLVERLAALAAMGSSGGLAEIERLFKALRGPVLGGGPWLRQSLLWRWRERILEEESSRNPAQAAAAQEVARQMSLTEGIFQA